MSVLPVRGSGSGLDTRYSAVQAAFFFDDLTQAGVRVCEFNPVRTSPPFRVDKLNHRDHRKPGAGAGVQPRLAGQGEELLAARLQGRHAFGVVSQTAYGGQCR